MENGIQDAENPERTKLSAIIRQKILDAGPMSFKEYMELALYHPEHGYYMTRQNAIGGQGDFYTSSSLGPAFGAMVARQIEEMWQLFTVPEFTVVEYGAGTGALCHDVLDYFRKYTDRYSSLNYVIIEKSPIMRERERLHLPQTVYWCSDLEELGEFTGCVFSNELIDNFAVHQVIMQEELMEVFVNESFNEVLKPANDTLKNYFSTLDVRLPAGFRTEVNLEAIAWLTEIARFLQKGYLLTIDYGYETAELYKDCRCRGTLLCYHGHQVSEGYYEDIGQRDITAHVNFSALRHWGQMNDLSCCGLTNQASFLLGLDIKKFLRKESLAEGNILQAALNEVRITHTLLVEMGNKFKVLIQGKDVPSYPLSGLTGMESAKRSNRQIVNLAVQK